jgi:hypothetical protein
VPGDLKLGEGVAVHMDVGGKVIFAQTKVCGYNIVFVTWFCSRNLQIALIKL